MSDKTTMRNPMYADQGDLLDGMDNLPDELQRFLRALITGLRAEDRHPFDLKVYPVAPAETFGPPDGTFRYAIRYGDPTTQPPGNGNRYLDGTWK